MMRWTTAFAVALMVVLAGCDREEPQEAAPSEQQGIEAGGTVAESGDFVRSDQWPDDIERIVSMAPNITEMLFELGIGDRVVAVTRYCDWPPEVDDLPAIGGMLDPDFEAILAAEPDVVVGAMDGADHEIAERFDRAGVQYGFLAIDDFDSVQHGIETLGSWLGTESQAGEVLVEFQRDLQRASEAIDDSLDIEEATALLVLDRRPIVAAGPGSFGGELLEGAGLINAIGDDAGDYPVLDIEKVLEANPDIIIDLTIEADADAKQQFWEQFDTLRAVEAENVVHLDDPVMLRPGPRIPQAVERLGRGLESL